MSYVICDIETAPLPGVDGLLPDFKPHGGIKDADKKAASIAEKREKAIAEAALDPDLCRIVYLGAWWPGDPHPHLHCCENEDKECFALDNFWGLWKLEQGRFMMGPQLLGYNLLKFDLPILVRRSLYLGVETPELRRGRYRHEDVCDLWSLLSEDGALPWRTLDYYCKRLDIPCDIEDTITGADVPGCVARGEWDKVRAHLLADLVKVKGLARRVGVMKSEVAA